MIGTTFKLGFDGTSVSRGLGKLSGSMARGFGKIATGAMERVGHRMTDLMGRIVMAIPETLKETADWAGGLTDMSTATGMSVEELVLLEEKFRLAGVQAKESGAVVSRFALNLKTAATEGGSAAEALRALGFNGQTFRNAKLGDAFDAIAQKIAVMASSMDNVEGVMADLFGAKLGYQQLKLFRDYAAVTKQAENNVGRLAKAQGSGLAVALDNWSDAIGRVESFKRSLSSIALDEFFKVTGGADGVNDFFDKTDPEKFRQRIAEIMKTIKGVFEDPGKAFGDVFRNIGKHIGDGIKESFKGTLSIKDLFSSNAPKPAGKQSDALPELQRHTVLLKQIRDESSTARFA